MKCSICKKEMNISEGITEHNEKRCHVLCKKQYDESWRKAKGLKYLY